MCRFLGLRRRRQGRKGEEENHFESSSNTVKRKLLCSFPGKSHPLDSLTRTVPLLFLWFFSLSHGNWSNPILTAGYKWQLKMFFFSFFFGQLFLFIYLFECCSFSFSIPEKIIFCNKIEKKNREWSGYVNILGHGN